MLIHDNPAVLINMPAGKLLEFDGELIYPDIRYEDDHGADNSKRETLHIPQKLYGRDREIASLMAAFDRAGSGKAEMMLVSGYSGIGKSSLVGEIHHPIVAQRGYFVSGKSDQFQRNIPYTCLIQAFRDIVRQLLTENKDKERKDTGRPGAKCTGGHKR